MVAPVTSMLPDCSDQPVVSIESPKPPAVIASTGNGPGGGHAIHGLLALPVPLNTHRHEAAEVEPRPTGPSPLDRIQRRWPSVVALPRSFMYSSTAATPAVEAMLLLPAALAPSLV